jgi:shikimate kinase
MNIVLIGARGSGKSTLGRLLAARLGLGFIDLDAQTLSRFDMPTVSSVWEHHGEAAWRTAEAAELAQALQDDNQVIAAGGGTPMIQSARELMSQQQRRGRLLIVFLDCSPAELARRLNEKPGDRPRLTAQPTLEDEINAVLAVRRSTFLQIADFVLDVSSISSAAAIEALARWMCQRGVGS